MIAENTQYEVALSFAGEQREYVERVARALQSRGVSVFYDAFELVRLWGTDLVEELHEVFEHRAALAMMFISKEYVETAWPRHERRSILSRAVKEKSEYVLPVRFDNTPVSGLPDSIRYEQADDHSPSVVTSKPANDGHFKTGQRGWPGTVLFYLFGTGLGKPVLVLQLRGPHLRMWP